MTCTSHKDVVVFEIDLAELQFLGTAISQHPIVNALRCNESILSDFFYPSSAPSKRRTCEPGPVSKRVPPV
jgi:hypothetical protein